MPSVHVIVPYWMKGPKFDLDKAIREEVVEASKELGEPEKIPDKYQNFSIVIANNRKGEIERIEIDMFLWPRTDAQIARYKKAIELAIGSVGLGNREYRIRVLNAKPEDWRGSMWGNP